VIDSHAYTFEAFRHACAPFRAAPRDAEIYMAFGPYERVILDGLLARQDVEPAYVRLQAYYAEHAGALVVHPEMRPLLRDCEAAGVRCGLFTGRGSDSTALLLGALDLAWAFDVVVAGDDVSRPKPAGEGVTRILAAFGCAPSEALLVGDSRLDLDAAREAGTDAILATWYAWGGAAPNPGDVTRAARPDDLRSPLGLKFVLDSRAPGSSR
jgi:HAD superfamily hydrolase (TIGR01509 family)